MVHIKLLFKSCHIPIQDNENLVVVVIDSYDVIAISNKTQLLEKFRKFKVHRRCFAIISFLTN